MGRTSRSLTVYGNTQGLTLNELRTLVYETNDLPDDTIVRVVGGTNGPDPQIAYAVVTWTDSEVEG